jgi:hypothetical protein
LVLKYESSLGEVQRLIVSETEANGIGIAEAAITKVKFPITVNFMVAYNFLALENMKG